MFIATVVTVICLSVLILESIGVVLAVALQKRPQRISFLRGFKKGKCAIIYLTAIPLYCVGHFYAGQNIFKAFFSAINKIINLVVLKYETSSIEALMAASSLYRFTIYFCFCLVGINAVLFTLSLVNQRVWEFFERVKSVVTRREKLFILGHNKSSITLYKSDKTRYKVIVDDLSSKDCEALYLEKISYISAHSYENIIESVFRMLPRHRRDYVVVINTGSDDANMLLCRAFVDALRATAPEKQEAFFAHLKVFVFGDPRYETIYEDIISSGFGCIHYLNKYQKIAMDFIDKYPLTRFMDERQIDYATSLVRPGVDINVLMIGFGKTNQQIFLTSVANNQFLTEGASDPVLKPVKYHIFDKSESENNKNLNHSYYRYKNECTTLNEAEYLPLPSIPAEEYYHLLDVNDAQFYQQIKSVVGKNKNDASFIVIAFGTDLENIDMAQKLVEKRREWNLENLVIFVKARVWHKEQTLLEEEKCYFIANERDAVYDIEKIMGDDILTMAKMRNAIYDLEYAITTQRDVVIDDAYVAQNQENANCNWYTTKSQLERESSLYCCLSLRSKLNLMGLDYCKKEAVGEALSEEEYMAIYAGNDRPDKETYNVTVAGKPVIVYSLRFPKSRRRNMAIHEHQRWNSFMISQGIIPASLRQIKEETVTTAGGKIKFTNGKNYAVRRHGNLTTFEGLIAFRQMIAARDKCDEVERDVIKYDYQLLDDAYWLLDAAGFKIVRKTKA